MTTTIRGNSDRLESLRNLGPRSAAMLRQSGIDSPQALLDIGSIAAWLRVRQHHPASLNLLWALEGAITGRRWQDVARDDRQSLLFALDTAQAWPDGGQCSPD